MKKRIIANVIAMLLFCSIPFMAQAATGIPNNSWNLQPTAYMEQLGIFSDPAKQRGIYNYTATVYPNGAEWFSDYYFIASAPRKYYFCGYGTSNPINQNVLVVMQNKFDNSHIADVVYENQSYFIYDYGVSTYQTSGLSDKAYFYFRVDNYYMGPTVTFNGGLETY